ncbi:MAG: CDP-diacylglycerol--serine O-phosphatidyltransferase [Chlamydiae bacterium]|nr:CDP-diacylglycerol--serine O-phosphatidyltransferase [Chlamydiota bacterium]MBI3267285.1 CDP-diacylglycerol--serine O-phosphatidyltransferase [Chlamydiota bacterium]
MRKIYLLPNLMTTGNFFCGVMSLSASLKGHFEKAALWILVAMLFDFLDGYVARLSKSYTKFGEEYDSLSDLTTFGIAPMILMYRLVLSGLGRLGISVAFIYSVSCALRLARYNAKLDGTHKSYFVGLPTPAAGGFLAANILARHHLPWLENIWVAPLVMFFLGFLMVSTIPYPRLSGLFLKRKEPFIYLVIGALFLGAVIFLEEICLSVIFGSYVVGGLSYYFFSRSRVDSAMQEVHKEKI